MAKRALSCILGLLAFAVVLATGVARADQASIAGANGQPANFPQVMVESGAKDASGQLVLMIVPAPGQAAAPLPIGRIQSISFGNAGEGRAFDVTLAVDGGGTSVHPGTTLLSYSAGQFSAIPTGGSQPFPIPAARIVTIAPGSAQLAPAAEPAQEETPSFSNDDFAADDGAGGDAAAPDGGDEFGGSEDFGSMSASDKGLAAAIIGGGIAILVGLLIFAVSVLVTTIWLIVWCFMEGDVSGGILLIFCGPAKYYYGLLKYDGKGKLAMQIICGLELLLVLLVLGLGMIG